MKCSFLSCDDEAVKGSESLLCKTHQDFETCRRLALLKVEGKLDPSLLEFLNDADELYSEIKHIMFNFYCDFYRKA